MLTYMMIGMVVGVIFGVVGFNKNWSTTKVILVSGVTSMSAAAVSQLIF